MENFYQKTVSIVQDELNNINDLMFEIADYPVNYLGSFLSHSGKKIRPVLAFLFLKMFHCEIDKSQLKLQASVELAHNASLIHDDIIDCCKMRRNSETFETKFDTKTAVMTGDYILSSAFKMLLDIGNLEIINDFVETFSLMSKAEINQYFERFKMPEFDNYIEKTTNKTAKLFETGLKSSAILAKEDLKLWGDFGLNFGIAFQIKNDLDNFYGDNSDVKNGIYTAPVIYSASKEITRDGIHKTELLINNYLDKCGEILLKCPQNEYREALEGILRLYKNEDI